MKEITYAKYNEMQKKVTVKGHPYGRKNKLK